MEVILWAFLFLASSDLLFDPFEGSTLSRVLWQVRLGKGQSFVKLGAERLGKVRPSFR